jgi:cell division protein FtsB
MLLFVGSIINSTCALISETFGDVEQLQRKIKELNAEIDGYQKQVANLESEIKEAKQTVDINLVSFVCYF